MDWDALLSYPLGVHGSAKPSVDKRVKLHKADGWHAKLQRFGLPVQVIQEINTVLARMPEVERAIIYGSRAKGNYKPGSDIDLTLVGEKLSEEVFSKLETQMFPTASWPPPRVIHLRVGNMRLADLRAFLMRLWPQLDDLSTRHKLLIVHASHIECIA